MKYILLLCSVLQCVVAFSVPATRRQLLEGAAATVAATAFAPQLALADVTNKVASSSALRYVKRAAKQLDNMELYVSTADLAAIQNEIRTSPLTEIRKNMSILVRGGEDGPDAAKLAQGYQKFISSLEAFDTTCRSAARGRNMPEGQLYQQYKDSAAALKDFLAIADEAVNIPLSNSAES